MTIRYCRECRDLGRRRPADPEPQGRGHIRWTYADSRGRTCRLPLCEECRNRLDNDAAQEVQDDDSFDAPA